MRFDKKVIDSHMHLYNWFSMDGQDFITEIDDFCEKFGLEAINICSMPVYAHCDVSNNIMCAIYKLHNKTAYASGGLVYPELPAKIPFPDGMDALTQYNELMEIGFDGIKLIESKPQEYKALQLPFKNDFYDDFFEKAEKDETPFVWHVADPDTFWDRTKIPERFIERGWFYGDGTYPSLEQVYGDVFYVLDRHPKLKVQFAHFFFWSEYPEKLEELFKKYENVTIDIVPGAEMYDSFNANYDFYRDFFEKYSDRIIYEIELTYYDNVGDKVKDTNRIQVLNKNSSSNGSKVSTYHAPTNTGAWKTVTIRLKDVIFDKSDEGYGDFRLTLETGQSDPKQLIISSIKVRNMTAKTQDIREVAAVPTVYIAADSIAANYALDEYGNHTEYGDRYGWGEKLDFGAAAVNDRAVAGQSTKNFNFQGIYDRLKKGDYVLICFGHNDSTASNSNIYVTIEQYNKNLKNVINTILAKGATPVVMTSIPTYNPDTYVVNTNDAIQPYRDAAMEVASECGILGFDLYSAFKAELESMPDETAKACYQNENDADWHKRVHLTESGAACVAGLITNALKNSSKIVGLQQYIE